MTRLPLLTYEELLIPLRFAFPDLVLANPGAIVLDVLVDIFEIAWIAAALLQARRRRFEQMSADADIERDRDFASASSRENEYTRYRVLRDVVVTASLHYGRVRYFATGGDLFGWQLAQLFRLLRVKDLFGYVRQMNNDLTTNVRFLAVYRFTLVLFSLPHWVSAPRRALRLRLRLSRSSLARARSLLASRARPAPSVCLSSGGACLRRRHAPPRLIAPAPRAPLLPPPWRRSRASGGRWRTAARPSPSCRPGPRSYRY
jgi:hypothetical protein